MAVSLSKENEVKRCQLAANVEDGRTAKVRRKRRKDGLMKKGGKVKRRKGDKKVEKLASAALPAPRRRHCHTSSHWCRECG